jgi:hypothetical protein
MQDNSKGIYRAVANTIALLADASLFLLVTI